MDPDLLSDHALVVATPPLVALLVVGLGWLRWMMTRGRARRIAEDRAAILAAIRTFEPNALVRDVEAEARHRLGRRFARLGEPWISIYALEQDGLVGSAWISHDVTQSSDAPRRRRYWVEAGPVREYSA